MSDRTTPRIPVTLAKLLALVILTAAIGAGALILALAVVALAT